MSYYAQQQGGATPLSAPSGTSQLETRGDFLKNNAPHGPISTSVGGDTRDAPAWAEFFGLPKKPVPNDPSMQFGRENFDLPEAFKGSILYLDLLIIYQIKISQMIAITRLLPLRQWDQSMVIRWDVWQFDDARLGRTPEETMSRLLTSRFDQGQATFHRWGLAFMLEHGFMNTPRGRMNYRCNLIQIANATIETLCYGVIVAIMSCWPMTFFQTQALTSINTDVQRDEIFREELDQWGCLHKLPNPIVWLWEKLAKKIRARAKEEPNILYLPYGSRASTQRPDEVYYFLTGKPGGTFSNNAGPAVPGVSVFESRDHSIGEGVQQDPAYQERASGQYAYMLASHLRGIKDCDYMTSMMDIAMIAESDDAFKRIPYADTLRDSGMFTIDRNTGKWLLTELGRSYFGGNYTYGDYLQEVGMLDKWSNQLADGCRKRRLEFISKFGDTANGQSTPANNAGVGATEFNGTPGNSFLSAAAINLANGVVTRVVAHAAAPAGPSVGSGAPAVAAAGGGGGLSAQERKDLADTKQFVNDFKSGAYNRNFVLPATLDALDKTLKADIDTLKRGKASNAKAQALSDRLDKLENKVPAAPLASGSALNLGGPYGDAERERVLRVVFNDSALPAVDRWRARFAAVAFYATGTRNLGDALKRSFEGKTPFDSEFVATLGSESLAKINPVLADKGAVIQLAGPLTVSVGKENVLSGWIPRSDPNSAPAANDFPGLFGLISTYEILLRGAPAAASGLEPVVRNALKAWWNVAPASISTDPPSLQFAYSEFAAINNASTAASADAYADEMLNTLGVTGAYGYLLGMSADQAIAGARNTKDSVPGGGIAGRFLEEAKYDTQQRNERLDDPDLSPPDLSRVHEIDYLCRQIPALVTLLDGEKNIYLLYHTLVLQKRLPGLGLGGAEKNRPHYNLMPMGFEHLMYLVEEEYGTRLEKIETASKGKSDEWVAMRKGLLDDSVKHLLQEIAFQRLIDLQSIVENKEFRPLFFDQMRSAALSKAAEEAKFSGPNGSLGKTLDVFEMLLPKLHDDFLTAWHNKLPDDVLYRLNARNVKKTIETKGGGVRLLVQAFEDIRDNQAKLSGVDSDAMDLKDDVPSDYFKTLFKNMRIVDGELIRFGLEHNMWPIIGLFLHKLYGTWLMGTAFAMIGDGAAGYTFQGHHDFQMQDDAVHKMHVGHWTLYARPVIIRADCIAHGFNIRGERYLGGNENTVWKLQDPEHVREFLKGNVYHASIIPVPVRINRPDPYWNYDVTNSFNKHLGTTPQACKDPSLALWARAWQIVPDPTNPLERPIIPRDEVRGRNTLVFLTSFLRYEEKTKALSDRVRGRGAWGPNEYDGCCQPRRGLNVPLHVVGAPGTNIVSIVY